MMNEDDKSNGCAPGAWSYDDLASIAKAIERMANDPEVLREVAAIERDFALNDGLES